MLRRLLRIVKVAREQEAPFIVTLKWLFDRRTWQTLWGQQEARCWQFYYASSLHRKPNRMDWGTVSDRLTAMLRPVSHVDRSPVPIPKSRCSDQGWKQQLGKNAPYDNLTLLLWLLRINSQITLDHLLYPCSGKTFKVVFALSDPMFRVYM